MGGRYPARERRYGKRRPKRHLSSVYLLPLASHLFLFLLSSPHNRHPTADRPTPPPPAPGGDLPPRRSARNPPPPASPTAHGHRRPLPPPGRLPPLAPGQRWRRAKQCTHAVLSNTRTKQTWGNTPVRHPIVPTGNRMESLTYMSLRKFVAPCMPPKS